MLTFGIDVVLLMLVSVGCITVAFVLSLVMPLDHDSGWACIISTTITATVITCSYVLIAWLLDTFVGTTW